MISEKELRAVFQALADDVNGFIAASLVDLDTGMMLADHKSASDLDLGTVSAFTCELVKQQRKALRVIGSERKVEDIMLILTDQIHYVRVVNQATFILLIADRETANLAVLRNALAARAGELA